MWANLHLLFWLSLFPLATEWIRDSNFVGLAVGFSGFVMLMAAVAYSVLAMTLVKANGVDSAVARALGSDIKGKICVFIYLTGMLLYAVAPYLSCGLYVLVAVIGLCPIRGSRGFTTALRAAIISEHVARPQLP